MEQFLTRFEKSSSFSFNCHFFNTRIVLSFSVIVRFELFGIIKGKGEIIMGYSDIKELLRDAKNFATGANDLQLKSVVLDIQDKVFELQEENRNLRDRINELKNEKLIESEMEYCNGVYKKKNSFFCTVCWDKDKRLSRVRKVEKDSQGNTVFSCDVCKGWCFSDIPWEKIK